MNVFALDSDLSKYLGIHFVDPNRILKFIYLFNGTPIKGLWIRNSEFAYVPRRMAKGDTPSLSSHIPVFSAKAVSALADLLEGNGELLPIALDCEEYFLFNVTRVVDALDEENSLVERLDDGRIFRIERHAFFSQKLVGVSVFKIPQMPLYEVYCTDPFVERVKAAKLKGFKLPLVWSSDD